jgi:hypothetical protein
MDVVIRLGFPPVEASESYVLGSDCEGLSRSGI